MRASVVCGSSDAQTPPGLTMARHGVAVRPSLSVLLVCLAACWAAIAWVDAAQLAWYAGENWIGFDPRAAAPAALAAVAAVCGLVAWRAAPLRALCAMAAMGLVAGSAAGSFFMGAVLLDAGVLPETAASSYTYVVETDPQRTATGRWRFEATVVDGVGAGARVWVDVPASAASEDGVRPTLPGMGSVVRMVGRWSALDPSDEFAASLLARGVAGRLSASLVEGIGFQAGPIGAVRSVRARLLDAVDPYANERRALIAGVVCGMQAALASFPADDDFADVGLSHLVAVSGSHLAVVCAAAGSLLVRSRARPGLRLCALAGLLALYVVFTGFQPSALRSWVMATASLCAGVAGRRSHALSAVGAAAFAMLLVSPGCAATMGFGLSVLSVVGLALFAGLAKAWTVCLLPRATPEVVGESAALTLVAQAFTLPVTLPAFGTVALLSPVANVAVGPLVAVLLAFGLAGVPLAGLLGAAAPDVAQALLAPCDALAGLSCGIARALAAAPGSVLVAQAEPAALAVALFVCSAALYVVWPRPSRRVALAALGALGAVAGCCFVLWRFCAPARVVVLDVGQGDAILIQDGAAGVLVDTGPDDAVLYALARMHVVHLDAVFVTHTDLDHIGGLKSVLERVDVDRVVVAQGVASGLAGPEGEAWGLGEDAVALLDEVLAADRFAVGRFAFEVLWPAEPVAGDENEDSLVMVARYGAAGDAPAPTLDVLLTGDAESEVVEPLLEDGVVGAVDVLKVGHHGSAVSTTAEMLELLDPVLAVASAGEGNNYGHPTQQCRGTVAQAGVAFLCTKDVGDVELRPAEGGVDVRCARAA